MFAAIWNLFVPCVLAIIAVGYLSLTVNSLRKKHTASKSMRHAGCKLMRVENIISELQPDGRGIQWRLHLSRGLDETLKLNVPENVASGLQKGRDVRVEINIVAMSYAEPA